MNKEKVLVLGANGFLGSHIVDSLVTEGFEVRAFDMYTDYNDTRFCQNASVEIFEGNFLNQTDLETALEGISYVIHLVSTTNPATAESDPIIDIDTNIRGSVELFQKCVANKKIKRIIFTSSGGTVYGEHDVSHPISEMDSTWPVSPYGIGKLAIENYLHYFDNKFNQSYTVFRVANPYGERQPTVRKQGVIPIFTDKILSDEPITVYGDGSMIRDYIYVKDVADIISKSLKKNLRHSVYNVGSGMGLSINQIIEEIELVTGKKAHIRLEQAPSTFLNYSVLDTKRFIDEFPEVKLTELNNGIHRLVKELTQKKDS